MDAQETKRLPMPSTAPAMGSMLMQCWVEILATVRILDGLLLSGIPSGNRKPKTTRTVDANDAATPTEKCVLDGIPINASAVRSTKAPS
jgi:hypothetical protein